VLTPRILSVLIMCDIQSGEIASTLTFIFYHLAQHPAQARKLQAELDTLDSNLNAGSLRSLDHLNAIISETLRLHPPILSGSYRNTPPEGIEIAGQHIPGDITVNVPAYSLHRCNNFLQLSLLSALLFANI